MLFKLALGNVKKSIRDYMIYFLTLTFGICLFYTFNSIEAQKAMMIISEQKVQSMQVLSEVMGYVSMFISVVLAFLVLYSNQFLIKRRKKDKKSDPAVYILTEKGRQEYENKFQK